MKPLAAAIVGTGFIGPVHVEALRRLGVPVIGVLGSSPSRSKEAAARWGIGKSYSDLDELLTDTSVDVVHVTSPNRLHFDQCRRALQAGKHVICEKPLALTTSETGELVRMAASRPRQVAAVCYNVRFYPLNHEARERVKSLGRVRHITGSYTQDWLQYATDFNWRVLAGESGPLRAIGDIGTHWLDLVQFITGLHVRSVCADLATFLPVRRRPAGGVATFANATSAATEPVAVNTEDYGSVLLRFEDDSRGVFHVSQVSPGRKNCLRYEIAAEQGAVAWNSEQPDELWLGRRDQPNELCLRDTPALSAAARRHADYPGGHVEGFPDSFKQLFKAVYEHIEAKDVARAPPFPTLADGHWEVALCEAIFQSAREQRWTEVPRN